MSEVPNLLTVGELVSSDPSLKAEGWQNLYQAMPTLIGRRNTGSLTQLCDIHRLLAQPATHRTFRPEVTEDMTLSLFSLDRPDSAQVHQAYEKSFDQLLESWRERQIVTPVLFQEAKVLYKDTATQVGPTTINLDPRIPGQLRSYGTRMIEGHPEEKVYASHTNAFMGMGYEMAFALSGGNMAPPPAYYGLSVGLDQITTEFGRVYDQLPIPTLVEALKKESYFQLIGTRALHPFWDGNGRAFGGFLAVSLTELGIQTSPEIIEGIVKHLSALNERLLFTLLGNSGLSLVKDDLHLHMFVNAPMRQDYMEKLSTGLRIAIEAGTDLEGPYAPLIVEGAAIIKSAIDQLQR